MRKNLFLVFPVGFSLLFSAFNSAIAADARQFEAEAAKSGGGASQLAAGAASGGRLVILSEPGQGIKFTHLPAAGKLAIHYASTNAGTISVAVVAPKEAGAGKVEIQMDDQTRAMADLSTTGARQARRTVCEVTGLSPGKHAVAIINRGPGPVAVDALVVREAGRRPPSDRDRKFEFSQEKANKPPRL